MKKLNLIFTVIIGIVFVAGCIGGEKANNSKPESNPQSSETPIGQNNLTEGYEVSEAVAMQDNLAGKVIFVNGTFVIGTEKWDNLNQILTFKMTDGKTTIDVVYKGDKPYIPSEATQTVVTGQFNNGVLEAFKMITRFQP